MKCRLNRWRPTILGLLALAFAGAGTISARPINGELKTEKKHGYWVLTFTPSAVTLKIPDANTFTSPMDMRGVNGPSYFYFVRNGGISLSGWFEPRASYKGLLPFWKSESGRFYANPATAPVNVIFGKIGQWELILYDQPTALKEHKVAVINLRAELATAGTWIDIHMSKGTPAGNEEAVRKELIAIMERVQFEVAPGAIVTPQQLADAVADLTDRIEGVDDKGYEKALSMLARHLTDIPPDTYPISREAWPWLNDPKMVPGMEVMLETAFVASLVQDDLQHRTDDRLYRAWLVVLKYYAHYTNIEHPRKGEIAWPRIAKLDELAEMDKTGQLRVYAQTLPLMRKVSTPEMVASPKPGT